jgi:hypothetical protein
MRKFSQAYESSECNSFLRLVYTVDFEVRFVKYQLIKPIEMHRILILDAGVSSCDLAHRVRKRTAKSAV